jgi:hypothetical protein
MKSERSCSVRLALAAADEIERLREALKKIAETEPESDETGDWWHMIIARAALKGG